MMAKTVNQKHEASETQDCLKIRCFFIIISSLEIIINSLEREPTCKQEEYSWYN